MKDRIIYRVVSEKEHLDSLMFKHPFNWNAFFKQRVTIDNLSFKILPDIFTLPSVPDHLWDKITHREDDFHRVKKFVSNWKKQASFPSNPSQNDDYFEGIYFNSQRKDPDKWSISNIEIYPAGIRDTCFSVTNQEYDLNNNSEIHDGILNESQCIREYGHHVLYFPYRSLGLFISGFRDQIPTDCDLLICNVTYCDQDIIMNTENALEGHYPLVITDLSELGGVTLSDGSTWTQHDCIYISKSHKFKPPPRIVKLSIPYEREKEIRIRIIENSRRFDANKIVSIKDNPYAKRLYLKQ